MVNDAGNVAQTIETHEALVWSKCVEATAAIPGNPLKAEVDHSGNTSLATLAAFNFARFNRVIAFGVTTPVEESDIDAVQAFYSSRSQSRFEVEVTPASQPETLADSLIRRGFQPHGDRVAKLWRSLIDIPSARPDVEVHELSTSDHDQYVAVSLASWELPGFFGPWFGATLGCEGFRHYGVFDETKLVSTSTMYTSEDVAWTGFGATIPTYRGRGFQTARLVKMMQVAASVGCRIIHNEADAGTSELGSTSLRNLLRLGYTRIYDKVLFAPHGSSPAMSQ
jgi:hypothetical protein